MAIFQKSSRNPTPPSPACTRSWSPTLAPPVVTSMSAPRAAAAAAAIAAAVSPATGSTVASAPASRTRAARQCALELTMPPAPIASPGRLSSSPVASTATRGRRCTASQGWLPAAASPTSRAPSRRPAGNRRSPAAKSWPWRLMCCPALGASPTITVSASAWASSCSSTQSAPGGMMLPVNRRTASPHFSVPSNGRPAGAAPTTRRRAPEAASAARIA